MMELKRAQENGQLLFRMPSSSDMTVSDSELRVLFVLTLFSDYWLAAIHSALDDLMLAFYFQIALRLVLFSLSIIFKLQSRIFGFIQLKTKKGYEAQLFC
jgi:hypothetical protein